MPGIAGVFAAGRREQVQCMMDRIAHRGKARPVISETENATWGFVGSNAPAGTPEAHGSGVQDHVDDGHFAEACIVDGRPLLLRDPIGIAPLYLGRAEDGALCFASEVKALLTATDEVRELPPGHRYDGDTLKPYFRLQLQEPVPGSPEDLAAALHQRLARAVQKCISGSTMGAWLSGGLDSSAMAALARPFVNVLHTFAAGLPGAPDLTYAREVADFLGTQHHEITVTFESLIDILPKVILHLESFDALLVRSSVVNYLVSRAASDYVTAVFSGEGGDELFAGYEYLKALDPLCLPSELIDITGRLHNTALQRVDRCASAHGIIAHVCFLDPQVLLYALRIPASLKLRDGVEKWILRQALAGRLPERVLYRPKAKFWEGAGVGELLAQHADQQISDDEFRRERGLSNGWTLNTKEELMYYRLFRETFGSIPDLDWMGRTKGAPESLIR